MKRVATDMDARRVEGVIVSERLSGTGLLKIKLDSGQTVVRHRDRLTALDDEARKFIRKVA